MVLPGVVLKKGGNWSNGDIKSCSDRTSSSGNGVVVVLVVVVVTVGNTANVSGGIHVKLIPFLIFPIYCRVIVHSGFYLSHVLILGCILNLFSVVLFGMDGSLVSFQNLQWVCKV